MSTDNGDHRTLDFLDAVCTPYPPIASGDVQMGVFNEVKHWEQTNPPVTVIEGWNRTGVVMAGLAILMFWVPVMVVVIVWGSRLTLMGAAVATALAAATARFRLEISGKGIVVSHSCLGIPYRRRSFPLNAHVDIYEPYDAPAEGVILSSELEKSAILGSARSYRELILLIQAAIERHGPDNRTPF